MAESVKLQPVTPADLGLVEVKVRPTLLRQALLGYLANRRQSPAHTKARGEVRGGGRKPWRQKGTGRARVGSSRTPLWRGGGVIFGPTNARNFLQTITAKARRQALSAALALKTQTDAVKMVALPESLAKTKVIKAQLPELYVGRQVLMIVERPAAMKVWRNLPNIHLVSPARVNALEVMAATTIVLVGDALTAIKSRIK